MKKITYKEIIEMINTIIDNGKNTAAKIRDVLTAILDYIENKESLETFHIFSNEAIFSTKQNAKLFFSIKGIKGQSASMTILIKPNKDINLDVDNTDIDVDFLIPFDQARGMFTNENFELLIGKDGNGVIPVFDDKNIFAYSVPNSANRSVKDADPSYIIITMIKKMREFNNSLVLSVQNFNNEVISTSISMHTQKFDEPVADELVIGNSGGNLTTGPRGKNSKSSATDDISFMKGIFGTNTK